MNDLDAYFIKNLSEDSASRVLKNVKELMKGGSDWSVIQSAEEPEENEDLPSNTQIYLKRLIRELEQQSRKKLEDLTQDASLLTSEQLNVGIVPMTAEDFSYSFRKDLKIEVIERSVKKSNVVAKKFID